MIHRVVPLLLLAISLCGAQAASDEPNWPAAKPVRLEVSAAAGGLIDMVPRRLSNYLSASIGVPVVVEDRPGAGGNIAAGLVARAEPDGHMLLVTGSNQAVNPILLPNPGFDYDRDLVPVSMLVASKFLLVASPSFPAKNITDLVKIARQKPKSVSIAISAIGTPNHLAAEMLAQFGDIDLTFVPYDSVAQAIPDLIAGRVDLTVAALSSLLPQVRSGALNALALTSPQRSPLALEIPTAAEAGMPELQIDGWICVLAAGGTPAAIVARLDQEIAKVLALPEVRDDFAKQGIETFHMDPNQLGAFLQAEAARFSGLLKHSRFRRASP
jgi:tripartite-type tricarboxylate transporter receptor subunit TctC